MVDAHLQEPVHLSHNVDLESSAEGGLEGGFSGVGIAIIKHIVDVEDQSDKRVVRVNLYIESCINF